jgi:hypothetical protein
MATDTTTQNRNKRLDDLSTTTNTWATTELKRLRDEQKFLESTLKGRTGAGRLSAKNAAVLEKRLVDEIDEFLSK